MKREWLIVGTLAIVVLAGSGFFAPNALAIKQFKDQFDAKYVKAESQAPQDVALKKAVDEAKCNVCHVGTSKKNRNPYGQALDALLDRTTDKDDVAKIVDALEKVAAMKHNPDDPNSPTFGDRLKEGKLPAE
ncbi:MAG: hypothetical protein ACOY3P_25140 [Planctomycetota bacterium]